MEIDEQRQQILNSPGHVIIEGGPGCGKTTIALLKALHAVDAVEPEQRVLFLSFSRAAVRQITDRMDGIFDRRRKGRLEVRTFHAFFLDIVRSHGRLLHGKPSSFIAPDRERQLRADFNGDWQAERRRLAREEGRYVFDLLAPTAAEIMERSPTVRALYSSMYPLIIVDEFQDTNTDQWRVVKAFSAASTIICLADPDQRIFDHIEGVDEHRIDEAKTILRPVPFDLSGDNHRSPAGGLLDYANAVLRNRPIARPPSVTYVPYTDPMPDEAAHRVIDALNRQLERQLGRTPTIAVLTTVNSLASRISDVISTTQGMLPAIDHVLSWDPDLAAAAGYVVASILEWPGLPKAEGVTKTLRAMADFYRVKVGGGTSGARQKVATLERALEALRTEKVVRSKTATLLVAACDRGVELRGDPVSDWQLARSRLQGTTELGEIFTQARLLRLLRATDVLAWNLADAWDGSRSYVEAAAVVRRVLGNEYLTAGQVETAAVSLMSMHRSKGKEFDGVVIVEGRYAGQLLQREWSVERIRANRRLLRVGITRARHAVVLVRPDDAIPLMDRWS